MANAGSAPTGCYKCGRPGHWSRDCPSSAPDPNPNPNSGSSYKTTTTAGGSGSASASGGGYSKLVQKSSEKPKKVPRTRPKLTPEMLLSDDGLGFVLRHFPRNFKYRGRGHEVNDLGRLIHLYSEWHSHLIPYYSFNQFVHKVEQVGATRRVKTCIRDLREKVANGEDPTKFHEPSVVQDDSNFEREAPNTVEPIHSPGFPSLKNHDDEDIQTDMLHEIYKNDIGEGSQALHSEGGASTDTLIVGSSEKELLPNQRPDNGANCSAKSQISDEQKARIEANRLRALEKAAARGRSLPAA